LVLVLLGAGGIALALLPAARAAQPPRPAAPPAPPATRPIFDALLHPNRPRDRGGLPLPLVKGTKPFICFTMGAFWADSDKAHDGDPTPGARAAAATALRQRSPSALDLEWISDTPWPDARSHDDERLKRELDIRVKILDVFRAHSGKMPTGLWAILPVYDFYVPMRYEMGRVDRAAGKHYWLTEEWPTVHEPNFRRWQKANDVNRAAVIDHVDFLCPALYTVYPGIPEWEHFARATLRESARLAGGKPVYPFLCPYYTEFTDPKELRLKPIPREFFRLQVELCLQEADGCVLWGGVTQQWDPQEPWVLGLRDAIAARDAGKIWATTKPVGK
jgi:hypothetical protein